MGLIDYSAKEIMFEKIKTFQISQEDINQRMQLRKDFVDMFTKDRIKNLTPEEYFPGLGNKENCIGYQLEWATIPLGSIKGGSMAKYGAKEQFRDIKKLLVNLLGLSDVQSVFYNSDGELTDASREMISQSQKVKGMKSGRTVLGKLLSIYYPNNFIPFFNDQNYLLSKIIKDYSEDSIGLESYLRNNYLFLKIKDELAAEPAFIKGVPKEQLTNDFLYKFLYDCFPRGNGAGEAGEVKTEEDERFEALETEHYQKLIHRNFGRLFKRYRYYDEEFQNSHEGHYATEDAGIMDFLCFDENENIIVIELKWKGTDETLAQLCRYMGWAKENLAKNNQDVLGIIVSESKDIRLEYAIKVVPNITLKQMRLDISLEDFS